jgi:integrase
MTWLEIDLDRATWRIPSERTKNKRPHTVPLTPLAVSIIAKAERRSDNDRLFGKNDSGFGGWSKAKAALDERIRNVRKCEANAQESAEDAPSTPAWTVHDIRRSVATHMAELGVLPHVIEALLNHVSGHKAGIAGVYNRSRYEREVRSALAVWAEHVHGLVNGGCHTTGGDPKVIIAFRSPMAFSS